MEKDTVPFLRTVDNTLFGGDDTLKQPRNWLVFAIVVLVWSSSWPAQKEALSYVGPLNQVLQRYFLSAIALSPLLILLRKDIPRDKGNLTKLFLLGVINVTSTICTTLALVVETSGISAVISYTQPIFVFCLSALFLRSEARMNKLLGVIVGFCGVIFLSITESTSLGILPRSVILLVLGAFLWAVAIVYYKISLSHIDPVVTTVFQLLVGSLVLAPLIQASEGFSFPLTRTYVALILFLSVVNTAAGLTLWLYLVREEDVTLLSSSSFAIPMVAVILGAVFLGESVELPALIGIIMILSGVYLVNRPT